MNQKHFGRPLVAGSSIGYNPRHLHVNEWDVFFSIKFGLNVLLNAVKKGCDDLFCAFMFESNKEIGRGLNTAAPPHDHFSADSK